MIEEKDGKQKISGEDVEFMRDFIKAERKVDLAILEEYKKYPEEFRKLINPDPILTI